MEQAGRVTSYTAVAPAEVWRHRVAVPVEDQGRWTLREPAAEVMDLRRSGQSSDTETEQSLRTAGPAQPAEQLHSPAPNGEERDVGRSLFKLYRVEDRKPGRMGRRTRCAGSFNLMCRWGAGYNS